MRAKSMDLKKLPLLGTLLSFIFIIGRFLHMLARRETKMGPKRLCFLAIFLCLTVFSTAAFAAGTGSFATEKMVKETQAYYTGYYSSFFYQNGNNVFEEADGTLHVAYVENYELWYLISTNGGRTWTWEKVNTGHNGDIKMATLVVDHDSKVFIGFTCHDEYDYGSDVTGGHEFYYDLYCVRGNTGSWTVDTVYTHPGNYGALAMAMVVDANNDVHLFANRYGWNTYGGTAWEWIRDSGTGTWGPQITAVNFSDTLIDHFIHSYYRPVVDSSGNITLIMMRYRTSPSGTDDRLFYVRESGVSPWESPVEIDQPNREYASYWHFDGAIDDADNIYLIYMKDSTPGVPQILFRTNFGAPTAIYTGSDGEKITDLKLHSDAMGNLTAFIRRSGFRTALAHRPNGGNWSPFQDLPTVALDGDVFHGSMVHTDTLAGVFTNNKMTYFDREIAGGPPYGPDKLYFNSFWTQINTDGFGDSNNVGANSMAMYDNELYVGTENSSGAEVWKYVEFLSTWNKVLPFPWSPQNTAAESMLADKGALYVGTINFESVNGAELWIYDGSSWSQESIGAWNTNNKMIVSMAVYNGNLYIGTYNTDDGAEVWEYNGSNWNLSHAFTYADTTVASMAVYDGKLYVGTEYSDNGARVWTYDGSSWNEKNGNGFGDINNTRADCMAVYNGNLYVGTVNQTTGGEVWKHDGSSWAQVNTDGFGDSNNKRSDSMTVHNGRLYVGTANVDGDEVWQYNGSGWRQINPNGFGDWNNNSGLVSMIGLNPLFVGTWNDGTGAELWIYNFPVSHDLAQTGQKTIYSAGDDGYFQTGIGWPEPRFTDNGDGTVTDNLTGLVWAQDANADGTKSWENALTYCNGLSLAGHDDWRLPNVNELEGLLNASESDSSVWLNGHGFTNVQSIEYWTSTTGDGEPNKAWFVRMSDGFVFASTKTDSWHVWAVRGISNGPAIMWKTGQTTCYDASGGVIDCPGTGQDGEYRAGLAWPTEKFTDHGEGIVTDNLTGLMWAKDANADGANNWEDALGYCNNLSLGGFDDWRLPNKREIHSLTDFSQREPALPSGHPFSNVQATYFYWSATTYAHDDTWAWIVDMRPGSQGGAPKDGTHFVWPVRGKAPPPSIYYVKTDGDDGDDGLSWGEAKATIQAALNAAYDAGGGDVWVKMGTYNEGITLKNGVNLYGGFNGDEFSRDQRDWENNVTTIDGQNAVLHVVIGEGNATIDGFTITGGNANNSPPDDDGGGMFNNGVAPTVVNCTFTLNSANNNGGGIFNNSCNPTIINCFFSVNTAMFGSGGGIYNNNSSSPSIRDCSFLGNIAGVGGGICNNNNSNAFIKNCVFYGNTANNDGGGICNGLSNANIKNCTFSGNQAISGVGGGIYNVNSSPNIIDCILWGNTATSGNEINNNISTPTISYSDIQGCGGSGGGWDGTLGTDGGGNIDDDPLFVSGYYLSQTAAGQGSDSPCVDAGSDTAENLGLDDSTTRTDLVNDSGQVDMGYHYILAGAGVSPGTYYVDISQPDDSGDGTSWATAWKTLHHAIGEINGGTPGDYILNVAAGTYSTVNGEDESALNITQSGVSVIGTGGSTIIDGSTATNWSHGIDINASSVIVKDLAVTGFSDLDEEGICINSGTGNIIEGCAIYGNYDGIEIESGSSGNIIRGNCEIYHNSEGGITINGSNGNEIHGNLTSIYDNGATGEPGDGIEIENGASNNLIHDNNIYWSGDLSYPQGTGIVLTNAGAGNRIYRNQIHGHSGPDHAGIDVIDCSPEIRRNEIYDNVPFGIIVDGYMAEASPLIENNLIYNCPTAIDVDAEGFNTNPQIFHNTIDGTVNSAITVKQVSGTAGPIIKYNIISNSGCCGIYNDATNPGAPVSDWNDFWNNTGGNHCNCSAGSNDMFKDPKYGSYNLDPNSPCIDAIPDSVGDPVTEDIEGTARPYNVWFDMGCYEATYPVYTLTIIEGGSGFVDVDPLPGPNNTYSEGEFVNLQAVADPEWEFDHWEGEPIEGSTNAYETITMWDNYFVTAHFIQIEYMLTVNVTPSDVGHVERDNPGPYYWDDPVQLTAVADEPGWQFDHWEGDLGGSNNPETINMDGDKDVTAVFTQIEYNLTVNTSGDGSVNVNPPTGPYYWDDTVDLQAVADPGWKFDHWSGDLTGSTNPDNVTMDGDKNVTAHFVALPQYTLTADVSPPGAGTVDLNPPGGTYYENEVVEVTANAEAGWQFDEWSGDLGGSINPDTITMDGNKTVTANFIPLQYVLTVTTQGSGSVNLNPPGGTYDAGTPVTLTANPIGGWYFKEWTGDLTGSTNPDTVTMDSDKNITAWFDQNMPPNRPDAMSPENEAICPSSPVTLQSSAFSDPDNPEAGDTHAETHWLMWREDMPYSLIVDLETGVDLTQHVVTVNPGLKYCWKVAHKDSGSGQWSEFSEERCFKVGTTIAGNTLLEVSPGTGVSNYRMMSVPFWPDDPSATAVFGDDLEGGYDTKNYRIGYYDPDIGGYVEYSSSMMVGSGGAGWVLARNGFTPTVDGIPVSTSVDIEYSPDYSGGNGWNQISCPNNANYLWENVQVLQYNADGSIAFGPTAISGLPDPNPYIDVRLWNWEDGAYVEYYPDAGFLMKTFEGYWIKVKADRVSLRFTVGAQASLAQPKTMFARFLDKGKRWIKNRFLKTGRAIADDGDSPPMPMGNLSGGGGGAVAEQGGGGGCFIATAAYGTPLAEEVKILSRFRDNVLLENAAGKYFVKAYYKVSPPVADYMREHETLRAGTRLALVPVVFAAGHPGIFGLVMFMSVLGVTLFSGLRRKSL